MSDIQQTAINALRFLAVDAVEKAKSGHPGAPLGWPLLAFSTASTARKRSALIAVC